MIFTSSNLLNDVWVDGMLNNMPPHSIAQSGPQRQTGPRAPLRHCRQRAREALLCADVFIGIVDVFILSRLHLFAASWLAFFGPLAALAPALWCSQAVKIY